MRIFNRKKTSENIKKKEIFKDFKRNITSKTSAEQQDLFFKKVSDTIDQETFGTKKGLSLSFEKIKKNHIKILKECSPENTALELMEILKRTNRSKFKNDILNPLIEAGFFELTIPEAPRSSKQKYRLTRKFVNRILKK
jgi:hypothetical protein